MPGGEAMPQPTTAEDVLAPLLPPGASAAPLLVLAAHPDDETLGASWLLSHGAGCHVAHVTDGAPVSPALRSPRAPASRQEYAWLREREARAALELAGVPPERLHRLGAVDQEAVLHLVELSRRLAGLLVELRPAVLVTHPYEGGHPDHDATAFVARAAVSLLLRESRLPLALVEMTSYHGRSGRLEAGSFLPLPMGALAVSSVYLSQEARALKRRMLACFGSQAQVLAAFPLECERFRAAPAYDFSRPPHAGELYYEAMGWMRGERWCELARRGLAELGLEAGP